MKVLKLVSLFMFLFILSGCGNKNINIEKVDEKSTEIGDNSDLNSSIDKKSIDKKSIDKKSIDKTIIDKANIADENKADIKKSKLVKKEGYLNNISKGFSEDELKSFKLEEKLRECKVTHVPWKTNIKNELTLMVKELEICKEMGAYTKGYLLHATKTSKEKAHKHGKHLFIPYHWSKEKILKALTVIPVSKIK